MRIMTAIAALMVCLTIRVTFTAGCPISISCECGYTGENVTVCVPANVHADVCARLSKCEACEDGFCSKCPEGLRGPFCSEGPRNCMYPDRPKHGRIKCRPNGDETRCTAWCLLGYRFKNFESEFVMTLNCTSESGWTPRTSFPDCEIIPEKVTCKDPGFVFSATRRNAADDSESLYAEEFEVGHSVYFVCNSSARYVLQGDPTTMTCKEDGTWSDTKPTCFLDDCCGAPSHNCEPLKFPKNGYSSGCVYDVVNRVTNVVETCHVQCGEGYRFKGAETNLIMNAKCNKNPRRWTRTTFPDCELIPTCKDPGFVENGYRKLANNSESPHSEKFDVGTHLHFGCNKDFYVFDGHSRMMCREDGTWWGQLPRCYFDKNWAESSCKSLKNPKNGGVPLCVVNEKEQYCTASCNEGYRVEESESENRMNVTCTGYTRQAPFPDCELIPEKTTCRDPGLIENGLRLNMDGSRSPLNDVFRASQSVVYLCTEEFALQGSSIVTCRRDGSWSRPLPVCMSRTSRLNAVRFCQDPGFDVNGSREPKRPPSPRGFHPGSRLDYSCNKGYNLVGDRSIYCLQIGQWTESRPGCETQVNAGAAVDYCENRGVISNGQVMVYLPSGNRRLLMPRDEREFPEGSRLEYSCDAGYRLLGQKTQTCEKPGFWSEDQPVCRRDTSRRRYCIYPGNVVNGAVVHIPVHVQVGSPPDLERAEYPKGSRLRYSCEEGYTADGPTILTCQSTGSWSPAVPPMCLSNDQNDRTSCENPGRVLNAKTLYFAPGARNSPGASLDEEMDEYPEGSALEYHCDKGFWLQGSPSMRCDSMGFWSAERPVCVGDCGRSFVQSSVRIRDGQETVSGEWPWVVSISLQQDNSSRFVCGGAVFNRRTIITAAHCLEMGRTYILRFGKHQFKIEDDDSEVLVRTSNRVIIHSDYSRRTLDSDIGLILFQPPIEYSVRVQPICMPTTDTTVRNIMTGRVGYVSGWGDTEMELPSESMLSAGLPVLSMKACVESYMRQNLTVTITGNMFCAGYSNGTYSVCGGDSGSPFVFYDYRSKRFTLEGLVSFVVRRRRDAQACGLPGRFAIFTRVIRFVHWIYENIE